MGSIFSSSTKMSKQEVDLALNKAKELASSSPVMVFSKTYCGYCKRVKQLLTQVGATFKVIELDEERDGSEIQAALVQWTGQNTVPNVFIAGKHVGGCDTVVEKYQRGELLRLLHEAGAIADDSTKAKASEPTTAKGGPEAMPMTG